MGGGISGGNVSKFYGKLRAYIQLRAGRTWKHSIVSADQVPGEQQ